MRRILCIFLLSTLAFFFVACEQPEPEPEPEKVNVSVSPTSLECDAAGATQTIAVTSNGLWYVKSSESWVSTSVSSGSGAGTVLVTVAPNTAATRTATLTFETADATATVSVSQKAVEKPAEIDKSIKEVRTLYKGTDTKITDNIFVQGVVISDYRRDTEGGLNNYTSAKTIVISDGTAGIMLYCKADNREFARGQKIRVSLKDQTLSVYQEGALQVNGLPLENITAMGLETPEAKEITVTQLLTGEYECMYVAVKEVQVKEEFMGRTFATSSNNTSITFEGRSGGEFDLFTSRYAVFRDEKVPTGSGTLKGIAGKYGSRYQISISQKSDYAGLTGERYDTGAHFSLATSGRTVSGDAGSFDITLAANVAWTASASDSDFSVSPSSGTKGGAITISYKENPSTTESRTVTIKFTTEDAAVAEKVLTYTIIQQPFEVVVPSEVRPWMEMPQVKSEEGKAFFSHDMAFNGKTDRNYSFWFDLDNHVALWVAYPLYSGMTKGVSRTDKWDFDPLVPRRYQADASRSYAGYDRGHQLPSADRLCNTGANEQTFYFTNITPQNANLNQGIWETLEAQVRGQIGSCDTLYVVTGCVVKTESKPDIDYVQDAQGKNVAVPKAYYKVILKYSLDGTYEAIGFWLENRSYGSEVISRSYAYTVDEIEKRTGFDFFHNLPDSIEKEVEARADPSKWGL